MVTTSYTSIWARVINKTKMTPEAARSFLKINFNKKETRRMGVLLEKSKKRQLSPAEQQELMEYCMTGDLLSVLHLHARRSLGLRLTLHRA